MTTMSYARIDPLLEDIEAQRQVIDARLARPARWRGALRREDRRGFRPADRTRYAQAFDRMADAVAAGSAPVLDIVFLRELNAAVIGGDGAFRAKQVRVGDVTSPADASAVPEFVEEALTRANDAQETPVLASARLHMELALIHPWTGGNGRTARLAASLLLMTGGFRSTLFTAVEQHSTVRPALYRRAFHTLRASRPTQHEPWLAGNLQLMAWNSEFAAAFRVREEAMRATLADAGEAKQPDTMLIAHDTGRGASGRGADELRERFPQWVDLSARMHPAKRAAFANQVERLVAEEGE